MLVPVEASIREMPPLGLGYVSESETLYFDPGTEVTVYLPKTLPPSIFTVGQEVDECGRVHFEYYEYNKEKLVGTFKDPRLDWLEAIESYLLPSEPKDHVYE
jgi:hypothetical protein